MAAWAIIGRLVRSRISLVIGAAGFWLLSISGVEQAAMPRLVREFIDGYSRLPIPELNYDYREYFAAIPDLPLLKQQEDFFLDQQARLSTVDSRTLKGADQLSYDHLRYEISNNLQRIELEQIWVKEGRKVPAQGLSGLSHNGDWYALFAKRFTSLELRAGDIETLGLRELARVKQAIAAIRKRMELEDSLAYYTRLQDPSFLITDKAALIRSFSRVDSTVRQHLVTFIGEADIPPVYPMEWPNAGAYTPPGIYLNRANNAYGKDVFQFNFYNNRFNVRAMEWIYMHEAIPGHHLQSTLRKETELQRLFLYPGNFEGWACYVEYFGKDMGLYSDPFSELGKWEWDLVRSARLVLDAGIHARGWTHEQALAYWKATIPGQDDIAEREVTRVTNWPGQALSYKAGADWLLKQRLQWLQDHPGQPVSIFHRWFMNMGNCPLAVLQNNLPT